MMRSLYSAVSGLKNHQTKMDVIGNNIANVNTTGFKKSTVNFATALSQTLKGASAVTTTTGGTNAIQIGLGSSLSAVAQVMTQGSATSTGITSNLEIAGEGYFVLQKGTDTVYTRDGTFTTDSAGTLVDAAGSQVMSADGTTPIVIDSATYSSYTIATDGTITGVQTADGLSATIGHIGIATFNNPAGLTSIGGNDYKASNNSGAATLYGDTTAYPNGTTVVSGYLEASNVDLASEFTDMIVAQRGFQANSRVITVTDTLLEELINLKRS